MRPAAEGIGLMGERLVADLAGGLFWPAEGVLVLADLHLEKGAAFAERGVPLPPYDTADTLTTVEAMVARHTPRIVIALGDSFHRAHSADRLAAGEAARLRALTAPRRWIWVAGNHDPDLPAHLGGEGAIEVAIGPLTFRHAPRPAALPGEVAGHLHPVARLTGGGRGVRRRCFACDGSRLVMPALGAYAGGLNVLDPAFDGLFDGRRFHAWMLGRRAVHPVPARRLAPDASAVAAQRRASG
jgi:hypothetical protein